MATETGSAHLEQLRRETQRWVAAGIVTPGQAAEILRLEEADSTPPVPIEGSRSQQPGRLPLVAELVSYLGIILVSASGALIVNRFWGDIEVVGRLAVGLAVAVLGLVGGAAIMRIDDPGALRLGQFLWLCGTGGVGLFAGVTADAFGRHDANVTTLGAGLAVLGVSVALWRNVDRPLQLMSAIAGAVMTVVGLGLVAHLSLTALEGGVGVWCGALILGLTGWRRMLHPEYVVLIVAEVGMLWGAATIASSHAAFGLILGLATATAAVGSGLALRRTPVIAVGILGFLGFLGGILGRYLNGPAAALGVFIVGVLLAIAAIRYGMRRAGAESRGRGHHDPPKGGPSTPTRSR